MTYVARHVFVDDRSLVDVSVAGGSATVSFSSSGSFSLHYPGRLSVYAGGIYGPGPGCGRRRTTRLHADQSVAI
jgi:hypothetical protein